MTPELSAALAIAIITQILKPLIEQRLGETGAMHDSAVRGLALALGVIGFIAHDISMGNLTGAVVWADMTSGLIASTTAVAAYHLLTSDSSPLTMVKSMIIDPTAPGGAKP